MWGASFELFGKRFGSAKSVFAPTNALSTLAVARSKLATLCAIY
jgi:hypothetical protein